MKMIRMIIRCLLAFLMIFAGVMHLIRSDAFMKAMPPYIPFHLEMVYLSGICEAVLGIMLLIPKFTRIAGWGLIALLIAIFPANIYIYQHQEIIPAPPIVHLLRLPLQGLLICWAYAYTRVSDACGERRGH